MRGSAATASIFGTCHNHESQGTFSSKNLLSNAGENKGCCHVIPGTKPGVEQTATQTQNELLLFVKKPVHLPFIRL